MNCRHRGFQPRALPLSYPGTNGHSRYGRVGSSRSRRDRIEALRLPRPHDMERDSRLVKRTSMRIIGEQLESSSWRNLKDSGLGYTGRRSAPDRYIPESRHDQNQAEQRRFKPPTRAVARGWMAKARRWFDLPTRKPTGPGSAQSTSRSDGCAPAIAGQSSPQRERDGLRRTPRSPEYAPTWRRYP